MVRAWCAVISSSELALEGHAGFEEQFRFFQGQHLSRRGLEDVRILARLHQDADFDPRAADPLDQVGYRRNAGEDRDWRRCRGRLAGELRP